MQLDAEEGAGAVDRCLSRIVDGGSTAAVGSRWNNRPVAGEGIGEEVGSGDTGTVDSGMDRAVDYCTDRGFCCSRPDWELFLDMGRLVPDLPFLRRLIYPFLVYCVIVKLTANSTMQPQNKTHRK